MSWRTAGCGRGVGTWSGREGVEAGVVGGGETAGKPRWREHGVGSEGRLGWRRGARHGSDGGGSKEAAAVGTGEWGSSCPRGDGDTSWLLVLGG